MSIDASHYVNRELSWLGFDQRVLEEALDASNPLLERLRFLAITSSNLDEFFMVRVGGLQMLAERDPLRTDPAGMTAAEQLAAISERTHELTAEQERCYLDEVEPALSEHAFRRRRVESLNELQSRSLEQVLSSEILPVLTPMAVAREADVFPLLPGRGTSICVRLEPSGDDGEPRFAIVPLGRTLSRFITLPSDGGYEFVLLEDVVVDAIGRLFEGEEIAEAVPFRVTRNADMGVREDQAADLLAGMQEVLDARRDADCVRIEIDATATTAVRAFLQATLEVGDEHVYATRAPLALSEFMPLADTPGFDALRSERWSPNPSPLFEPGESVFEVIARGDVLLHHPYESFEPVQRMIEEAADDPDVLAIKQTLYRTSRKSPIVAALARAAENGKHVTALVELKARFDEARNITWARELEQAGVQVVYGVKGLKTHAKICLVVRREPQGIRRYVHLGTGNYNESTARLYTDVSLLTIDEELGSDASRFFHAVAGYSQPEGFRRLDVAPMSVRERVLEMIRAETARKQHGQPARILAKLNSLVDPAIIEALYEASSAGVEIRLNVRGICCLRPGVPGLSDNIEVVSIVDRLLEHSRIFHFLHGGEERAFLSSADWMPRNLDRRVELLVPVDDPACRDKLRGILETSLRETAKARRIRPDGGHERRQPKPGTTPFRSQAVLQAAAEEAVRAADQTRRTVFEPHRADGEGGEP